MDHLQRTSYEKDFRIAFLESKGDGFQRLFEKLMGYLHYMVEIGFSSKSSLSLYNSTKVGI